MSVRAVAYMHDRSDMRTILGNASTMPVARNLLMSNSSEHGFVYSRAYIEILWQWIQRIL